MRYLMTMILLCCGVAAHAQQGDSLTAIVLKTEIWDANAQRYTSAQTKYCHYPVVLMNDRIRIWDEKSTSYYSVNGPAASGKSIFQCYDKDGNKCMVSVVKDKASSAELLVVTYEMRVQYTYVLDR